MLSQQKTMRKQSDSSPALFPLLCILLLFLLQTGAFLRFTEAGKRRVHIPDDLDDVIDDEEDEDWKKWGQKSKKVQDEEFDPPNLDLDTMSMEEIQAQMMKRQVGPAMGFIKLRFDQRRSKEMVANIAMRWTKLLKSGTVDNKFMAVDLSTLMFNLPKGQDIEELKEFVLSQPEAYEIKIGDQLYRRPGDPPLEEVIERLRKEQTTEDPSSVDHRNDEL